MAAPNNEGASAAMPHLNSRPKRQPAGDEEATSQLKLGEFQNAHTLNLSEARVIINVVVAQRKKNKAQVNESEVLVKTTQYLEDFARFREREHVTAVERLLASRAELEKFERSQLGSLCPEEAEKAKALIPSLEGKISDDDLQDLLLAMLDSEAGMA